MRRFLILAVLTAPCPLDAQEFEAPRARQYPPAGTFRGTVKGTRIDTLYNGDIAHEKIDCAISMRFEADGTVVFDTGPYFYERFYFKKTTTGGFQVGHTRMTADGVKGSRTSRLRIGVTQYGDVWNASWTPLVQVPSTVLKESWLTDGRGRTWGHSAPLATYPTVSCEPRVLWRDKGGKGPGKSLQNLSYDGPDVFRPWARVHAEWSFSVLR